MPMEGWKVMRILSHNTQNKITLAHGSYALLQWLPQIIVIVIYTIKGSADVKTIVLIACKNNEIALGDLWELLLFL